MVAAPIRDAAPFAAAMLGAVPPHVDVCGLRNGPTPVLAHPARPRISAPREADIYGADYPVLAQTALQGLSEVVDCLEVS